MEWTLQMHKPVIMWIAKREQLLLRLLLLAVTLATLVVAVRVWNFVDRMNRPELSVNDVYLTADRGYPLALVADYQNVGRSRMAWLQVRAVLLKADMHLLQTPLSVVRANPTP